MFALVAGLITRTGVVGVFLLMLIENLVPAIPSEIILPLAGYEAAQGKMAPWAVVLAGAAGSVLGALVWYGIGRWLGPERFMRWAERHGRWLTLSPSEVRRAQAWFQRWGGFAVALGRTLPGVRGVIAIPAGISAMPLGVFVVACSIGSLTWSALLTGVGWVLRAHFALVQRWLDPATAAFLAGCALIYLYRVVAFRPR